MQYDLLDPADAKKRAPPSPRLLGAFWVLGILNNYQYVVMLSAAEDIISGEAGAVLVCDILPTLVIKATAPFWAHRFSYGARVYLCTAFALASFLIVAAEISTGVSLIGVMCASVASGWGETTFLALTSFYDTKTVTAWSSGTGMAGIAGAGWYLLLTDGSLLNQSPRTALLLGSVWPLVYAATYRWGLPAPAAAAEEDGVDDVQSTPATAAMTPAERWARIKPLLLPYMLPLSLVYFAEYLINTGVAPTIGFPDETNKSDRKSYYVLASFIYQVGVFVSRSSATVLPLRVLWPLPLGQLAMLAVMLSQAMAQWTSAAGLMLCLVFVEGLFGGATYVNAFTLISTEIEERYREFSLSAASVGDSMGILIAAVTSLFVECALLKYNGVDMEGQDISCIYD